MIYVLKSGTKIKAKTPEELVKKLNDSSLFGSQNDIYQYMQAIAERCDEYNHVKVRIDNFENFVEDLIKHGLATPEKDDDLEGSD